MYVVSKMKRDEREFKIIKLLIERGGSLRFKDIWESLKGSKLFNSKRDVYDTLYFLDEHKHIISKYKVPKKNITFYFLAADIEKAKDILKKSDNGRFDGVLKGMTGFNKESIKRTLSEAKERNEYHSLLKKVIKIVGSAPDLSPTQVSAFYGSVWFQLLKGYMVLLEYWVRAPDGLDDFVKKLMIEHVLEKDYEILSEMGHAFSEGMDECLKNLGAKLDELTKAGYRDAGLSMG
jgi:transcription initiation factor IIE alpha subunit